MLPQRIEVQPVKSALTKWRAVRGSPPVNEHLPARSHAEAEVPGGIEFKDLGIAHLMTLTVGNRIEAKLSPDAQKSVVAASNYSAKFNKLIFWQFPKPKLPIRRIAKDLLRRTPVPELKGKYFIQENTSGGVCINSVYSMINRYRASVENIVTPLLDSVVITHGTATQTPFLLRKINNRIRIIVVEKQSRVAYLSGEGDAFVAVPESGADENFCDQLHATIRTIVQRYTIHNSATHFRLKGNSTVSIDSPVLHDFEIVFVMPDKNIIPIGTSFSELLDQLYEQSLEIMIDGNMRLRNENVLTEADNEKKRILLHELALGARVRFVNA